MPEAQISMASSMARPQVAGSDESQPLGPSALAITCVVLAICFGVLGCVGARLWIRRRSALRAAQGSAKVGAPAGPLLSCGGRGRVSLRALTNN